jgi:hypothetical protein
MRKFYRKFYAYFEDLAGCLVGPFDTTQQCLEHVLYRRELGDSSASAEFGYFLILDERMLPALKELKGNSYLIKTPIQDR